MERNLWLVRFRTAFLLSFLFALGTMYANEPSVLGADTYAFSRTERPDITRLVLAQEEKLTTYIEPGEGVAAGQTIHYGKAVYWRLPENVGKSLDAVTVYLFGNEGIFLYRWRIVKDGVTSPTSVFDFDWYAAFGGDPVYTEDPWYVGDNFTLDIDAIVTSDSGVEIFATVRFAVLDSEGNSTEMEQMVKSSGVVGSSL